MDIQTKQCPMCAETIKAEAKICRFCGARFEIKITGYCANCHEMQEADENGLCKICGGALIDQRIESELVREKAPGVQSLTTPLPQVQAGSQPKKRSAAGCAIGILLAVAGISIIGAILLQSMSTASTAPTRTPVPTRTPIPTNTLRPTRTSTPAPVEVTFDTIGNYPTGRLVILVGKLVEFSSTVCDTNCGVLLQNPSRSSQKITIFIDLPSGDNTPAPNQMMPLHDQFEIYDVRIRMDNGDYVFIGQTIRVTGRVCKTTSGNPCVNDILRIELYTDD